MLPHIKEGSHPKQCTQSQSHGMLAGMQPQNDASENKLDNSSHLSKEQCGGGISLRHLLKCPGSRLPRIFWGLLLNQAIQRSCLGQEEALPSVVDHLFVQEKKDPSDGEVIPKMDQGLGATS